MYRSRSLLTSASAKLGALATTGVVALAISLATATGATATDSSFSFALQPSSSAISACLPNASGHVTITTGALNDVMTVTISGMPKGAGFDLFVIQQPGDLAGCHALQRQPARGHSGAEHRAVPGGCGTAVAGTPLRPAGHAWPGWARLGPCPGHILR